MKLYYDQLQFNREPSTTLGSQQLERGLHNFWVGGIPERVGSTGQNTIGQCQKLVCVSVSDDISCLGTKMDVVDSVRTE